MKRILLLAALACFASNANCQEKKPTDTAKVKMQPTDTVAVVFTAGEIETIYHALEYASAAIVLSEAPSNEVQRKKEVMDRLRDYLLIKYHWRKSQIEGTK